MFNNHGNRDNKLRARMKWLVDTLGWEDVQARIIKERRLLLGSSSWPGGIPAEVEKSGDAPAGVAVDVAPTADGPRHAGGITRRDPFERWDDTNVVRGAAKGTVSAIAYARLGDVTSEQFRRWPPSSGRWASRSGSPTARTSPSAASPRSSCPCSTSGSTPSAWPSPAPSWSGTS